MISKIIFIGSLLVFMASAHARYGDDVLVRGEITGVDGKFVILALKRRLVMVPRGAILKRYPTQVGEKVIARLPLKMIRVTGNTKKRPRHSGRPPSS